MPLEMSYFPIVTELISEYPLVFITTPSIAVAFCQETIRPVVLLALPCNPRMSAGVYDLLADIAARCNIKSENILKKSKALVALLNSKQQLNCSDTCKVVVCLELASSLSSSPLCREEAIKYSGCKRRIYTNHYNNISKLLNLDKVYSIAEICLLVGASDVKEPATKLLQKYKNNLQENDFEHPMYGCAAVLCFCRAKKIKLNLAKLVEISRVKKSELEELSKKFSAFLEFGKENEKTKHKKADEIINSKSNELKDDSGIPKKKKNTTGIMSDKEYEEWKRRMLEE